MIPKLSNLKIVLGYWNENSDSCFRFNNPKQFSNWIILISFCSSHLSIKNYSYNVHFIKFKKWIKNSKKFVYYNENMNTNSNFKSNYLENYNDSEIVVKTKNTQFFMIFSNKLFLYKFFFEWGNPLTFLILIYG